MNDANSVVDVDDIDHLVLRNSDGGLNIPESWSGCGVYACFDKKGVMQYVAMSRKVAASIEGHMQVVGDDCHSAKAIVWDKPLKSDLENTARAWIEKCVVNTGDAPPGNTPDILIWRTKPSEVNRAKPNLQFEAGATAADAEDQIKKLVGKHRVVLFMKGTRQAPQCGFSDATIALLEQTQADFECVDCLDEDRNPGLREAIKAFTQWPTIPQLFVKGEFVGGADLAREMFESGELQTLLASGGAGGAGGGGAKA